MTGQIHVKDYNVHAHVYNLNMLLLNGCCFDSSMDVQYTVHVPLAMITENR